MVSGSEKREVVKNKTEESLEAAIAVLIRNEGKQFVTCWHEIDAYFFICLSPTSSYKSAVTA